MMEELIKLYTIEELQSLPEPLHHVNRNCHLRRWKEIDDRAVAVLCNEDGIAKWMRDTYPWPYTYESARFYIREVAMKDDYKWCIADSETNIAIGAIGLKTAKDIERLTVEVGYWVGKAWWGKGIITDVLRQFATRTFKHLRLGDEEAQVQRISANVFQGNEGSMKVLQRTGFSREGTLRNAIIKRGVILDMTIFAMTWEDCERLVEYQKLDLDDGRALFNRIS